VLVIGQMRPFLIFALLRGTPFPALAYASKVSGLVGPRRRAKQTNDALLRLLGHE
jgi:hypothetical protein